MKRDIRKLKDEIKRLQPIRSPGQITGKTTRGVIRRPLNTNTNAGSGGAGLWA